MSFICKNCDKKYVHKSSYYRHKNICEVKHKIKEKKIDLIKKEIDGEIWKQIPFYEPNLISNHGRIFSKQYNKLRKQTITPEGYVMVGLSNKKWLVHRLVYTVFIGDIPDKMVIDHINNIRNDNRISNLRLYTQKQNCYNKKKSTKTGNRVIQKCDTNGNVVEEYDSVKLAKASENITSNSSFNRVLKSGKEYKGFIWKYKTNRVLCVLHKDEMWKDIKEHPGYKISNYGNLKHKNRKRITNGTERGGYKYFNLNKNSVPVNRLVALYFVKNLNKKFNIVNHIDENKLNNYYKNLEWTDIKGNTNHSKHKWMNKVQQIDKNTNKVIKIYDSYTEAGIAMGNIEKRSMISKVCKGKGKTAYGYKWKKLEVVEDEEVEDIDYEDGE